MITISTTEYLPPCGRGIHVTEKSTLFFEQPAFAGMTRGDYAKTTS